MEYALTDPDGLLVLPDDGEPQCAVLVLSGSSGRIEADRGQPATGGAAMARGGNVEADKAFGSEIWQALLSLLGLDPT
ncbi:hypothetical protein [Pseudonocardia sp. GCM10023141]|uniref:hypothetical protein n=1 Tax=Pseudonocardia sp. GCM10023141 TaxID=3252653 RepID=UPI00360FE69B